MAATAQDSTAPLRMGPEKKDEDVDEYESERVGAWHGGRPHQRDVTLSSHSCSGLAGRQAAPVAISCCHPPPPPP